jgi:membrane associated rhomboid family serine protease
MSYYPADDQDYPRTTPAVRWLIAINVAIYFLQRTLIQDADMFGALGYDPRDLTRQPWTVVTYMFVHGGLMHLAANMYGLWLFGRRVEREWGAAPFLRYYLLCGLGGWLLQTMFERGSLLIGASGAVYGVMLAYAMRWPDEEIVLFFLIPMKVKWLVVLYAALDLIAALQSAQGAPSPVAHWAHLGGFAMGWLYLRASAASASRLDQLRRRVSQVPDVSDEPPRVIPRSSPRPRERASEIDEVVARSNAMTTRRAATPALVKPAPKGRVDQLNDVLDKISQHGLQSLTTDERRLLEEMSKTLRNQ